MTLPDLAVELQLHILNFVLEDESGDPFERRTVRGRLRRVCKAYNDEISKKTKEVSFPLDDGHSALAALSAVDSSGEPVARTVERLFISTGVGHGRWSDNENSDAAAVIAQCLNVVELGIQVTRDSAVPFVRDFAPALAQLTKLKHVAIYGPTPLVRAQINRYTVRADLPRWPSLESLAIKSVDVRSTALTSTDKSSVLTHISYKLHHWYLFDLPALLARLPPNLLEVELDVDIFSHRCRFAPDARAELERLAPQLTHISLLNEFCSLLYAKGFQIPRGKRIDHLVSRFTRARHLTIPTCAVTEWAVTLAPLLDLVELNIVESDKGYLGDIAADDLSLLLPKLPKLKRLSLSCVAWARWSKEEQTTFKDTATNLSITFSVS